MWKPFCSKSGIFIRMPSHGCGGICFFIGKRNPKDRQTVLCFGRQGVILLMIYSFDKAVVKEQEY